MDRNTFTGLFLILIILVGSTFLMQPSDEDIKREKAKQSQDSIARVNKTESPVIIQDTTKNVALPAICRRHGADLRLRLRRDRGRAPQPR